ncbi:MAG: MarC family protein [Candidatus Brockarchaeota archaeon]|nr:MarC family protein [Candidatus Brockarchaeota archaeon]
MFEEFAVQILRAVIALFVIIDPIGNIPIFMSLTEGMTSAQRRKVIEVASITGLALLVTFAVFGIQFLNLFNISLNSFRVAGGVLLLLIALKILMEGGWQTRASSGESGAVPLGFPLLVGPGAITTTMVTMQSLGFEVTLMAISIVFGATVACLALSERIYRLLGQVGSNVFARVMAIFIAAIAVEFVMQGVSFYLLREAA